MGVIRHDNRVAAAFRLYARLGLDAPMRAETRAQRIRGLAANKEQASELFAVWETLHLLAAFDDRGAIDAVRALWMQEGMTAAAFALQAGCSERSLYRRLEAVRNCYERLLKTEGGWA